HIERHVAAAALDQQDLKQVAMAMGANGPIVHRRARCNPLDVNEVERLIVRRIAVKMEQRQRPVLANHAASISRSRGRRSPIAQKHQGFAQTMMVPLPCGWRVANSVELHYSLLATRHYRSRLPYQTRL